MPVSALLLHIPPGECPHLDWLLPHPGAADADPLLTLRITRLPDDLPVGQSLDASRLPDHRAHYLEYEGELSGGRGVVRRLRRGPAETSHIEVARLRVRVAWSSEPACYEAWQSPDNPRLWRVTRTNDAHPT